MRASTLESTLLDDMPPEPRDPTSPVPPGHVLEKLCWSGLMPVINVQMLSGRTAAQKSAFVAALADVTKTILGVPEESVRIILTDVAPQNWGVGDQTMAQIRRLDATVHESATS